MFTTENMLSKFSPEEKQAYWSIYPKHSTLLPSYDIAELNLKLAYDLPGSEGLDHVKELQTLDSWTQYIKDGTTKRLYMFSRNPREYQSSEAYFRMLVMATLLYKDIGVKYNDKYSDPESDTNATDSRTLFIHGPLQGFDGTCANMPVLFVAIGQRLGYPLHLVSAIGHFFVRWEDESERFNIEATSKGLLCRSDEHYKKWPFPISNELMKQNYFLKNHKPREIFAAFLALRGHCFFDNLKFARTMEQYYLAHKFAPNEPNYKNINAVSTIIEFHQSGVENFFLESNELPEFSIFQGKKRKLNEWERLSVKHAREQINRLERIHNYQSIAR